MVLLFYGVKSDGNGPQGEYDEKLMLMQLAGIKSFSDGK